MAYTNSKLATYKPLNKNHYDTRTAILGIVPHCVVGKLSIQDAWSYFRGTSNASCNYYIDWYGNIACFVDEKYGAWTTSSYICDMNHVTVEIASEPTHPYAISAAAYNALIKLTADIYKRNGLNKCIWTSTTAYDGKPGGVPMHRNYKNKACPGDHIVNKYMSGNFCDSVNKLLAGGAAVEGQPKTNAINDYGFKYQAHCQTYGWCEQVHDGQLAGTSGESKRLEALRISAPEGVTFNVKVHIQRIGWKTFTDVGPNTVIGTVGEGKRIECIEFSSVKGLPEGKKLRYQVHVQGIGWMPETTQGYPTGTMNQSKRIEAIRIWVA